MRFRLSLMPAVPIIILIILVVCAIAAPLLTLHSPLQSNLRESMHPPAWLAGGSSLHLLGTDRFGRDILARLLYGARVSLTVATFALLIATLVGGSLALIAAYRGGWIDSVIMRLVDMVMALPTLLVALALAIALRPSMTIVVLVIGLLTWPRIARIVRGEVKLLREQEFVRYSAAIGVPGALIILRHIIPNVLPTLLVVTTLEVGHVILIEASLSFLGAGIPAPQASWGGMISDGAALISTGWWLALFPGIALLVTVMTFNLLGDWLRDHYDPKLRGL